MAIRFWHRGNSGNALRAVAALVAGALLSAGCISSSPTPSPWTLTGPMTTPRMSHVAARLNTGAVLIAGGYNNSGQLASAELFLPTSGTFVATGSMAHARDGATATLLNDGTVLVAGGWAGTAPLDTAEIYDPASGTFSPTGSLNLPRTGHTATLLQDGTVLVAGGVGVPGTGESAEIYDPVAGVFKTVGSLTTGRTEHTATLLKDGRVLVAGGFDAACGGTHECDSAELYDPTARTFTPTGSMTHARGAHTGSLLPDGRVLVAGGRRVNLLSVGEAELFDPATGSFSVTASMYNQGRQMHTATTMPDGRVVLIGGAYNFSTAGGQAACTTVEVYTDFAFILTAPLEVPRAYHTATLLADGRILVAGGANGFDIWDSAEVRWP